MVSAASTVAIVGVAVAGILYQFLLKGIVFQTLGVWRAVEPLSAFNNVRCEKVDNLGLEACEDMWMHEPTGYLYMACSNSATRMQWTPAIDRLNASGRSLVDRMYVLDTRGEGPISSRLQAITPEGFSGVKGDGTLNLHGFDVRSDGNTNVLRMLLLNHRPSLDPVTGELADNVKIGANSTVELFQTEVGSATMKHIRTYAHEMIECPNRVQWVTDDAFVFTNDHSAKVGLRRALDFIIGGGSLGYCDRNRCSKVLDLNHMPMPNGVIKGHNGLLYLPSTGTGEIIVISLKEPHKTAEIVDRLQSSYPIDNMSIDKNGDIFAASFPEMYKWVMACNDPYNALPPSAAYKISTGVPAKGVKGGKAVQKGELVAEKVIEDVEGGVLPGSTIVVHDPETGRYFFGGAFSPFITICESR